eukprot:3296768-Amphidinium_carterae.1
MQSLTYKNNLKPTILLLFHSNPTSLAAVMLTAACRAIVGHVINFASLAGFPGDLGVEDALAAALCLFDLGVEGALSLGYAEKNKAPNRQ